MESKGLSSDSEKLLYEIVDAINPTQMLGNLFKDVAPEAKSGLRRLVKELQQYGYIDVVWADNIPCMVTLKSLAEKCKEQFVASKKQTIIQSYEDVLFYGNSEPKPISVAKEGTPQKTTSVAKGENAKPIIFISHRSTDKELADRLAEFFYGTGIPSDTVFCSSLPGNDVKKRISDEVKAALKASAVNIVILSRDYYQSAYCLQEAGVIWYRDDVPVVLVALPEINEKNIYGFFDKNDILRRLDSNTDILEIYDDVSKAVSAPHRRTSAIALKSDELMRRYAEFLKKRETTETETAVLSNDDTESKAVSATQTEAVVVTGSCTIFKVLHGTRKRPRTKPTALTTVDTANEAATNVSENHDTENKAVSAVDTANKTVFTPQTRTDASISKSGKLVEQNMNLSDIITSGVVIDDQQVILYYVLKNSAYRVSKDEIHEWLHENEIHDVNVDNAFYLLSFFDGVAITNNILELEINTFNEFILYRALILPILEACVNKHKKLASDTFKYLWEIDEMRSPVLGLFIAYIIDERRVSLFIPSVTNNEISNIETWELKNKLDATLSNNYVECLSYFIRNALVYERKGINNMLYLCQSLQELLFNNSKPYRDYVYRCKQSHKK